MSNINTHNYESYVIDYLDGNLSEVQKNELELFTINHPELNISLDDFPVIEEYLVQDIYKNLLYKSVNDLISEEELILYTENQLSKSESAKVIASCNNNLELRKELSLFELTKIIADNSIVFPYKQKLKKGGALIVFSEFQQVYKIAASLLFLIGLFIITNDIGVKEKSDYYSITQKQTKNIKIEKKSSQDNYSLTASSSLKPSLNSSNKNRGFNPTGIRNNTQNSQTETNIEQQIITENRYIDSLPVTNIKKESTLFFAQNNQANSAHKIILLNEEDDITSNSENPEKKKGFWAIARNTLQKLNRYGVKSVDGNEANLSNNTSYELTLGPLNIQHKTSH
jgi:hypothetical protein